MNTTGPRFNIKMSSCQYRKSHCGDRTVVRSSYLHNGVTYTGKMSSLYWSGALELTDNKSILVRLMTWCRRVSRHYIEQWWTKSFRESPSQLNIIWINHNIYTDVSVNRFPTDYIFLNDSGEQRQKYYAICELQNYHSDIWLRNKTD